MGLGVWGVMYATRRWLSSVLILVLSACPHAPLGHDAVSGIEHNTQGSAKAPHQFAERIPVWVAPSFDASTAQASLPLRSGKWRAGLPKPEVDLGVITNRPLQHLPEIRQVIWRRRPPRHADAVAETSVYTRGVGVRFKEQEYCGSRGSAFVWKCRKQTWKQNAWGQASARRSNLC